MTDERIEFVDREYGQCVETNPARQIRTRALSFHSIKRWFDSYRLSRLQSKLERKVDKAMTQGYSEKHYEEEIGRSASVIARLEEKIMLLSKQDVPKDYVSRRAIKLRKAMIENLTHHSTNYYGQLYSVGLENKDKVMGPGIVEEEPVQSSRPVLGDDDVIRPFIEPPVSAAAMPKTEEEPEKIDVVRDVLDRQSIIDSINASFDHASDDEIHPVIDPATQEPDVPTDKADDGLSVDTDEPAIDKEALKAAVEEAFARIRAEKDYVTGAEDDSIHTVINSASEENSRVSRNNVTSVHPNQYDADGNRVPRRKKYNYKPMTDEEIREAQIKLGFDEHGNLIDAGTPVEKTEVSRANVVGGFTIPTITVRDAFVPAAKPPVREVPVVVPERSDTSLELDDGANMFDIIPQEEEIRPVAPPTTVEGSTGMTIDDYEALKEKILLLKKQQEESHQQRLEAQRRAQEIQEKVRRAKEEYEASQASYNERMARLRAYAASLEAACSENETVIAETERESREGEGFVRSQEAETDRTNQIVSEIDSMMVDHPVMGDTSTPVVIK